MQCIQTVISHNQETVIHTFVLNPTEQANVNNDEYLVAKANQALGPFARNPLRSDKFNIHLEVSGAIMYATLERR